MTHVKEETMTVRQRGRSYELAFWRRPAGESSILYLHGLGSTKADFEAATEVDALKDYTLAAVDLPGAGASSDYFPEIPLGLDDLVEFLQEFTSRLGLEDLTVIGHSLGGLTGLLFARANPQAVARFVSVEGNLGPADCEVQSRDVFRRRFLGDEDAFFQDVQQRLGDSSRPGFEAFLRTFRDNIADRAYFDYCRSIVDYSDNAPLLDWFIELPMPRMYVHGERNSSLPHLNRLIEAGVPVLSVPGSDHFPVLTNPGCFYAAVAEFVSGGAVRAVGDVAPGGRR